MNIERITKLDAAIRQLDTAITLWFTEADTISIHTLACSAHQIIHDINQQKGHRDLLWVAWGQTLPIDNASRIC